ncbi:hypothetical protein LTR95_002216 [Oleoguttula sp. CCFEE 5521]
MPYKRTRPQPTSDASCAAHILPCSAPMVSAIAAQNGVKPRYILAHICAGVPEGIHPAFDLEYVDVLGTVSNASPSTNLVFEIDRTQVLPHATHLRNELLAEAWQRADLDRQQAIEAIRPAFRLASAILMHPDQLPFWHGIWRAGRAAPVQSTECRVGTFTAWRSLRPEDTKQTLQFLEHLGLGVFTTFRDLGSTFGCMLPPPVDFQDSVAMSKYLGRPRLAHDRRPRYARLHNLWFRLAKTMLHELAHAAVDFAFRHTYDGRGRTDEPFFRSETAAEVGKAYENYTFGGYVAGSWQGQGNCNVVLGVWPSEGTHAAYQSNGSMGIPTRGSLAAEGNHWNVPTDHVSRLFGSAFWEPSAMGTPGSRLRMMRCCQVRRLQLSSEGVGKAEADDEEHSSKRARVANEEVEI